jgi:hypothetical protein
MTIDASLGHGEDGKLVPVAEFDFDAVEKAFESDLAQFRGEIEQGQYSQEDVDRALVVLAVLLKWIWQGGMKNVDGLQIRAVIVCWVFLKELRPLTETDLARAFGKDKQSFGRWVENFKEFFPRIRIAHMR